MGGDTVQVSEMNLDQVKEHLRLLYALQQESKREFATRIAQLSQRSFELHERNLSGFGQFVHKSDIDRRFDDYAAEAAAHGVDPIYEAFKADAEPTFYE